MGSLGATAEDETPSVVCGRPATKRISAPGVRDRYRCDQHAKGFEALLGSPGLQGLVVVTL